MPMGITFFLKSRIYLMKTPLRPLVSILLTLTLIVQAHSFAFTDIQYWVGSGTNQAALVIDWNLPAGNQTLVWGYRWDGTATGGQMLNAIVNADARLYA